MTRKYLPADAYRFLVLTMLHTRRGAPASKGELAWETRANHTMITRVLRDLSAEGLVAITDAPTGGYDVALTDAGRAHVEEGRAYAARAYQRVLSEHFRYGRAPAWAAGLVD